MSNRTIYLAHMKLVLPFEVLQKAREEHKGRKYMPSLPQSHTEIVVALQRASANGGIPATLEKMEKEGRNSLVDFTEDFERRKTEDQSAISYSRVESVGEDRTINRDIYLFHLHHPFQYSEKDTLCLKDNQGIQGQVHALKGQKLTIKFNLEAEIQQRLAGNRDYTEARQIAQEANREYQDIVQETEKLVTKLERSVKGLASLQAPAKDTLHATTVQAFYHHYRQTINILEQRSILLADWRDELKERKKELYDELCQYADVVGATCIGIATSPYLKEVDFHVTIVDEAGQIALPDLLVPLVRAEKAVLVGDHQQLPPYVDNELDDWLKTIAPEDWSDSDLSAAQIRELLTKSTFEQLFTANPDEKHHERFIWQHRMPEVIADFAGQHFYDKSLKTALRTTSHNDPLFYSPFVFIDLPEQLQQSKQRTSGKGNEHPARYGYTEAQLEGIAGFGWTNLYEAELAARIATIYEREGNDWVIIVPFRAQARHIHTLLKRHLGKGNLDERVATVDSFQGGERQKVIYSFTRSNKEGKVGFLKELRRLNVALTRAKEQLILIGDMETLSHAQNQGFRNLAQALQKHVLERGEYISYTECQQRLSLLEKQEEAE